MKLRLPRKFAEKWFEALESGKYKQGVEFLKINSWDDDSNFTECKHCCLGVAAEIIENKPYDIEDCNFIGDDDYDSIALEEWEKAGYPRELIYVKDEEEGIYNRIPSLFSNLNDGISIRRLKEDFKAVVGEEPEIPASFYGKVKTEDDSVSFSFKEIVEFTKANFELY